MRAIIVLRIRDGYPGYESNKYIPDPHPTNTIKRRENFFCPKSFVAINFTINWKIFISEKLQQKFEPINKEFKYFLPQKLLPSSQKYGFGILDPGSRGQKGTGSERLQYDNVDKCPPWGVWGYLL